jgi:hypothetical protein
MSTERVNPDSLVNHPAIIAAAKSGDIKRLNRLLAELAKEQQSAQNGHKLGSDRPSDGNHR